MKAIKSNGFSYIDSYCWECEHNDCKANEEPCRRCFHRLDDRPSQFKLAYPEFGHPKEPWLPVEEG